MIHVIHHHALVVLHVAYVTEQFIVNVYLEHLAIRLSNVNPNAQLIQIAHVIRHVSIQNVLILVRVFVDIRHCVMLLITVRFAVVHAI